MLKNLIVIFNSIILFVYSFFDNGGVSITGNFPANVKPGTEVTAEVIVKKGGLGGFAKLQIEAPAGVTIKESESKGGNFSFTGSTAKWIWTGVPSEAEFTIKFIIAADASVSGSKPFTAKYSYVENNNKQIAEMAPVEVMFGEGGVTENKTPDTNTTSANSNTTASTNTVASNTPTSNPENTGNNQEPSSPVTAQRTITKGAVANEWNIEIKIKKDGIKGFARYSDDLPEGFTAKQGKTDGSSFSVADNKVKFVWVNVPSSDEVNISYTLNGAETPNTILKGEFSYLENNQSKSYKLSQEKLPPNAPTENVVNTNTTATNTNTESTTANTNTTAANTTTESTTANTNTTAVNTTTENTTANNNNNNNNTNTTENTPSTNSAISFGVQIGAFTNINVTNRTLGKLYGISETIRSEMDNGLTKFIVGKYAEYKGARDHRENVKNKGVSGAFVTAYNGPRRISVQEALMIANQKWLK